MKYTLTLLFLLFLNNSNVVSQTIKTYAIDRDDYSFQNVKMITCSASDLDLDDKVKTAIFIYDKYRDEAIGLFVYDYDYKPTNANMKSMVHESIQALYRKETLYKRNDKTPSEFYRFMNIPWGTDLESVVKIMINKGYSDWTWWDDKHTAIFSSNIMLGNIKYDTIKMDFLEYKNHKLLQTVELMILPKTLETEQMALLKLYAIKSNLERKYKLEERKDENMNTGSKKYEVFGKLSNGLSILYITLRLAKTKDGYGILLTYQGAMLAFENAQKQYGQIEEDY